MAARRTFEDGMAILMSIARSDAFKEMRGRIRDGASSVADNDRVPRVIASSAGIVAALLNDEERDDQELAADEPRTTVGDPSEMVVPSSDEQERIADDEVDGEQEAVPESVAAVRDLEGAASLDSPPEQHEEVDEPKEDTGVLPFTRRDEGLDGELAEALSETAEAEAALEPEGQGLVGPKPAGDAGSAKHSTEKVDSPAESTRSALATSGPAKSVEPVASTQPSSEMASDSENDAQQATSQAKTRPTKSATAETRVESKPAEKEAARKKPSVKKAMPTKTPVKKPAKKGTKKSPKSSTKKASTTRTVKRATKTKRIKPQTKKS